MTPPVDEPVGQDEARNWLRVDQDLDDALIRSLVTAARQMVERETRRAIGRQTLRLELPVFPAEAMLELPLPPLRSVTSVAYLDGSETLRTFASSSYTVSAGGSTPGWVMVRNGSVWPSTALSRPDAVRITFEAGYGDGAEPIPEPLIAAVRLALAHLYENRQGGDLPEAFRALCGPYVVPSVT